ncbi:MAG: heme lyase CcmF/NrfE family subunit [Thermoanaerobaculia bacterium]
MIAPLGRGLVLISLLIATIGAMVGFAAGSRQSVVGTRWTRRFAYAYSLVIALANAVMIYALLVHDFSVSYVAHVGSRLTPTWVTIVSLWSSLEGSILFWGLILGVYIAAATFFTRDRHPEYMPWAIGTWLAVGAFFSFLISGPANPFGTVPFPPMDGPGPNPLLQNHILMVAHPPFLYLGYVGMTIPFGLASAALLTGRLGHAFLKPLRTWTLIPWIFLTIAIMLGGWWAYEVLGWGGYWAWDPVENASLLPWLTATAAVHSLIVQERKGILKGWTVTLLQATFLLTILGTFMTRSGVFNSVHSFTQSAIGPTILAFLAVALLWSVVLLALKIDKLSPEGEIEGAASRESMFLVNNLLFVLFTFTVLIGTAFPLIVEAIRGSQMSVGRPYFDRMAVPIGAALLFIMGVGPALPWGRATKKQVIRSLVPPIIGAVVVTVLGYVLGARNPWTLLTLAFGGYTAQITLREMWLPFIQRVRGRGENIGSAFVNAQLIRGRRRFGAYIVHAAVVAVIVAIAVSSTMQISREFEFRPGQSEKIGAYTLTLQSVEVVPEPNREATIARFAVSRNGKQIATLEPRMNQYLAMREPIGTPDVLSTFGGDLYLSAMSIDASQQTAGIHAMINPLVGWIWFAVLMMGFGALVTLIPTRSAATKQVTSSEPLGIEPAPSGSQIAGGGQ